MGHLGFQLPSERNLPINFEMFRTVAARSASFARSLVIPNQVKYTASVRFMSKQSTESDARYKSFFERKDIDGWECRKAMNYLSGMDLVPDPQIIIAALHACRRLNDYALATRFLETVKDKCGSRVNEIYPYILQEIQPTLKELGISTIEEMGYDKPELALQSVYDM